jgi:hypothetical protein
VKSLIFGQVPTQAAVPAAGHQVADNARLLYVDNIRLTLTVILVVFHLAITYGAVGSWFYIERPTEMVSSVLLTLFTALNAGYFMGLFYFAAGYFVPSSLDRKGTWGFLRDRLIRLGIPLLVFYVVISPLVEGMKSMTTSPRSGALWQEILSHWQNLDLTPGPMWFVEGLLVFSAAYALGHAGLALLRSGASGESRAQVPLTQAGLLVAAVLLTAATFAVRQVYPKGVEWQHVQLGDFAQYIVMFAAGVLARRWGWLPEIATPIRRTWTIVAIALAIIWLPMMIAGGALTSTAPFMGGPTAQAVLYSAWESFFGIAMAVALLAFFYRRFNSQGPLVRVMSKSAYTVYVIHAVIIVYMAYVLRGLILFPALKWVLLAPVSVALSFAAAYLVRKIPGTARVL